MSTKIKLPLGVAMAKKAQQVNPTAKKSSAEIAPTLSYQPPTLKNADRLAYHKELKDFLHNHLGIENRFFVDGDSQQQHEYALIASAKSNTLASPNARHEYYGSSLMDLIFPSLESPEEGANRANSFETQWHVTRLIKAMILAMVGYNVNKIKEKATGKKTSYSLLRIGYTAIVASIILLTMIGNTFNLLAPHLLILYVVTILWVPCAVAILLRSAKPIHPATLGIWFGAGINDAFANLVFFLFLLTATYNILSFLPHYLFTTIAVIGIGLLFVVDSKSFKYWTSINWTQHRAYLGIAFSIVFAVLATWWHGIQAVLYYVLTMQISVLIFCAMAVRMRALLLFDGHPENYFDKRLTNKVMTRSPWMACVIGAAESGRLKIVQWYERRCEERPPIILQKLKSGFPDNVDDAAHVPATAGMHRELLLSLEIVSMFMRAFLTEGASTTMSIGMSSFVMQQLLQYVLMLQIPVIPIAGLPFVLPVLPAFTTVRHMGVSALRGGRAAMTTLMDVEAQLKKFERHVPMTAIAAPAGTLLQ